MKVINPLFVAAANPLAGFKVNLDTWFANHVGVSAVSFDQIRTVLGKDDIALPDGVIAQQLKVWGYKVLDE